MPAYYSEKDPKAAAWLRELVKAGHIAPGDVDERSIADVTPMDIAGYDQCHFFAGIGGWSYALRLAGWEDTRSVWTGSCPCQPFSAAGKGGGFDDERHLWPHWHHLIRIAKPRVIFGEQVASKDGLNWFDLVHADLENEGYAVGAADLCAAGVGAPHIRQRLYFVAESSCQRLEGQRLHVQPGQPRFDLIEAGRSGEACKLADSSSAGLEKRRQQLARAEQPTAERSGELADAYGRDASAQRQQRSWQHGLIAEDRGASERAAQTSFWSAHDSLPCIDGKARPVEPGTFPLASRVPHRVGLLRGYGNAIVAPQAAEFIRSYDELSM